METQKEHILLVESDPQVCEVIAQQTLRPLGYQVDVFESASTVIRDIDKISPDIIITNLHLPGISGKDLLVALNSQGIDVPVIVITPKGREHDALQAFRLGADNFLTHPIREAEVVNVVEDTLNQLRKRKALEIYTQQVDRVNEEMEKRIRDYNEIFSIGLLISSSSNQQSLYEKLTNAAIAVTHADAAWVLVFDFKKNKYILRACPNAGSDMQSMLHLPYENNISSLIEASGQVVSIHGDAVKRFNLLGMVESILVVPIKQKQEVVGMIAVERKTAQPFNKNQQAMLELIAEYAAVLLGNFLHFQKLEHRLSYLQQYVVYATIDSDLKNDLLRQVGMELRNPINSLTENLDHLTNQGDLRTSRKQSDALNTIQKEVDKLTNISDSMLGIQQGETSRILENVDLNEMVRDVVNRFQKIGQVNRIMIKSELPSKPTIVTVFSSQIIKVIEGLISNALKYSPTKSPITIRVEKKDDCTMLTVKDQGEGINENLINGLFDKKSSLLGDEVRRFGGIGISLPMVKEIISAHRGEIWVESGYGKGFTVIFSLPQRMT
jgi:K+-sensing histidine kinase KdpD/CheY-like chemotaxis protein